MTRKEMIYNLRLIQQNLVPNKAAIPEIIKALSAEPCEDAVSREELYEVLNTMKEPTMLDAIFDAVENLPSVRPTRVRSKWEKANDEWRTCSNCGLAYNFADSGIFAYCPCCGAEMEGEECD